MSFGNDREFIDHLQNKEGKEQAVKCPLLCIAMPNEIGHTEPTEATCLKEECAWWDSHHKKCGHLTLALSCDNIHHHLEKIEKKMPHAGQFIK